MCAKAELPIEDRLSLLVMCRKDDCPVADEACEPALDLAIASCALREPLPDAEDAKVEEDALPLAKPPDSADSRVGVASWLG